MSGLHKPGNTREKPVEAAGHTATSRRPGTGLARSPSYTEQERAALALTEEMTRLAETQEVSDEVYQQAVRVFSEEQYRVVAWAITVINAFNRLSVTSRKPLPA